MTTVFKTNSGKGAFWLKHSLAVLTHVTQISEGSPKKEQIIKRSDMTKGEHLDPSFHAKGAVIIDLFNGTWIPLAVVRTNGTNHILGDSIRQLRWRIRWPSKWLSQSFLWIPMARNIYIYMAKAKGNYIINFVLKGSLGGWVYQLPADQPFLSAFGSGDKIQEIYTYHDYAPSFYQKQSKSQTINNDKLL